MRVSTSWPWFSSIRSRTLVTASSSSRKSLKVYPPSSELANKLLHERIIGRGTIDLPPICGDFLMASASILIGRSTSPSMSLAGGNIVELSALH